MRNIWKFAEQGSDYSKAGSDSIRQTEYLSSEVRFLREDIANYEKLLRGENDPRKRELVQFLVES